MSDVFICDTARTPVGRYGGALATVRTDDLAAIPIKALIDRHPGLDWEAVGDVVMGCANQAGEDNRNVARMAGLLAGLPISVGGTTINRNCASGMDAIAIAARVIALGESDLMIAGGAESMSRSPFVMGKAGEAFSRKFQMFDSTTGWRFVNPRMKASFGVDSMPETAENVAKDFNISRADQDVFALGSQRRAAAAQARGRFAREIAPVSIPQRKGEPVLMTVDEHPRPDATLERLAKLTPVIGPAGTVTAGNASGVNDGAAALLLASEEGARRYGLTPRARFVGFTAAGVLPRIMGMGPEPATRRLLARLKLDLAAMDVIELNEAFASQALAVMRHLGLPDDAPHVNPNGGAIALGHPVGMSGARLVITALFELEEMKARRALCTMCVGVGQGTAAVIERV